MGSILLAKETPKVGGDTLFANMYKAYESLSDGLKIMWDWAKIQPKRDRFVWPEYELDKGIYEYWK